MNNGNCIAALFDLDGVIIDTESQYSFLWHQLGVEYLGMDDLEIRVKGQTLTYIYNTFFAGMEREQAEITIKLDRFEEQMTYNYIPGAQEFLDELRHNDLVKTAVVTSSNDKKMASVYRARPEIRTMFDRILTAEMFAASKPAPDCYLLGMELFGVTPDRAYVFEDSFNGLKAGMASGATVIGLATTNSHEAIAPLCHTSIDDFRGFTFDKMLAVKR